MLHSVLFAPFAEAARQAQYEAVEAALKAAQDLGTVVLLGNFLIADEAFDAVIIRPHSITSLLFVPGTGLLSISAEQQWQLEGQPLADGESTLFAQLLRQQPVLATWLSADLSSRPIPPAAVTGLVVFEEQVRFSPDVEHELRHHPEADNFHLLRNVSHLPRRLWQLTRTEITLSETALLRWAQELAAADVPDEQTDIVEEMSELVAPVGFWEYRARQLWRWLGAEDVPPDLPYGYQPPSDAMAARLDEKERLEQIRQQVRAELQAQNQAVTAREAEREQTIAALRAQLQQATAQAPEAASLQARLAAETQEKEALAAAVRTAQAELAARNHQLDTRITELGNLLQELQRRPQPGAPAPAVQAPFPPTTAQKAPVPAARRPSPPAKPSPTWQLQWHRVAVVAAIAGGLGWGVWGAIHLAQRFTPEPTSPRRAAVHRSERPTTAEEDIEPESVQLAADSATQDSTTTGVEPPESEAHLYRVDPEPADSTEVMPEVAEPELDDTATPNQ